MNEIRTERRAPTTAPVPPAPPLVRVELNARTAIGAVLTLAAVWLFLELWQVLLVVVVALMFVGLLNPFVQRLERRGFGKVRLGRDQALAVVFTTLFLVLIGFGALTVPRLVTQVSQLIENFPEMQATFASQLDQSKFTAPLAGIVRELKPDEVAAKAREYGFSYGPRIVEITAYTLTSMFLALYLMIDRDRMRGSLFAVVPRRYHLRLSRVLIKLQRIVGGYMLGQVITSSLMAAFTFIVLTIAGVDNALALALFAGLADVLPYIGALLACAPATLASLSQGTTTALVVLAVLATYQELESRVIVPRVYGSVLRLPASTVMIALLVGGKLLGILGALLALPIAAGIRMIFLELRVGFPGDLVDRTKMRARDAAAEAEFASRTAGLPASAAAAIATEIAFERRDDDEEHSGAVAVAPPPKEGEP